MEDSEAEESRTEERDSFEDCNEMLQITPVFICKSDPISTTNNFRPPIFITCIHPGNQSQEGLFKVQNRLR